MTTENKKKYLTEVLLVIAILAGGFFIRFVDLTGFPPGLYPDEAMNLSDGLKAAEAGTWPMFFENNNGREGLYMDIIGYLLHWFGPQLWIVRFLPALIGALTLPAVYWLGRRLTNRFGALIALALMTFSYWHLNFSRIGFRAILMVGILSWAFAFLIEGFWRLLKKPKNNSGWQLFFILGGLFLGLSLHTYIAVRIVPAVLLVLWFLAFFFFTSQRKNIAFGLLITGIFAFLTASPLLYDFYHHPDHFTGRASNVSVLKSPHVLTDLSKSLGLTFLSFLFYGDQNWRHNYPYLPLLMPFWGIFLLAGFGWGILILLGKIWQKIRHWKTPTNFEKIWPILAWGFLIAWWFCLLAPSFLTNEGLPHALRSIGALPATFLLVGFLLDRWFKSPKIRKIIVVLVIFNSLFNVYAYFFLWGRSPDAFGAFEYRLSAIGAYLRETIPQNSQTHFYLITNSDAYHTDDNLPVMVEPIRFYTWEVRNQLKFIVPEDFQVAMIQKPAIIAFVQKDQDITEQIKKTYPQAKEMTVSLDENNPAILASPESFLHSPYAPEASLEIWEVK